MKRIDYCYHTHTKRCGHAEGEDEQYVIEAINLGLKALGFSDHVMLPGIPPRTSRAPFELLDDYLDSISSLKEKYKDKIGIKVGFEAEYSKRFEEYYRYLFKEKKIDYLILGQHFDFDNSDTPTYIRQLVGNKELLDKYIFQVRDAINSGLFKYIAHPDIFACMYDSWNDECTKATREICEMASKARMPLEINCQLNMVYKKYPGKVRYPFNEFWQIVGEYDIPVVIAYDSHKPADFRENIDYVYEMAEKYNLHLVYDYRI